MNPTDSAPRRRPRPRPAPIGARLPVPPVDLLLWPLPIVLLGSVLIMGADRTWTEAAVAAAVAVAAVLLGRVHPLPAIAVVLLTAVWLRDLVYLLPVPSLLAGLRLPRTTASNSGIAALCLLSLGAILVLTGRTGELFTWGLILLAVLVCPYLVGRFCRQYGELVRHGWERADQLEREQRILAEQERLRERARIAEDMHDSLGHELSLIAMRAGVLEVTPGLDEPSYQSAAAQLRTDASRAAEALQEVIGILDTSPRPGGADSEGDLGAPVHKNIADLVAHARAAGMAVELHGAADSGGDGGAGGSGEAHRAAPPSRMVRSAVYRVVQESLTNAAKHAPGAPVRVTVRHGRAETSVTVTNGPPAAGPAEAGAAPGGRGLVGLRERVRVAGGTLRAGPRGAGFEVAARLPHTASAHPPEPPAPDRTESARQREHAQRRLRRDIVMMIATPVGLAGALTLAVLAYIAFAGANSVLPRSEYDRLRVGQPRAAVEAALPRMEMIDAPADRSSPAPPRGSACRMYRSHAFLDGGPAVAYRLCFAGDRLVSKDALPLGVARDE